MDISELEEHYIQWLLAEAFPNEGLRRDFEACMRELHRIPFYWTIWSDENRVGDALSFRQYEYMEYVDGLEEIDPLKLGVWATASPSVLEVLLGIARRWSYYFQIELEQCFLHLFINLGLNRFETNNWDAQSAEVVRDSIDIWLSRQFDQNGVGSPFPLKYSTGQDMRKVDIWGQMNAYSAEHFQ